MKELKHTHTHIVTAIISASSKAQLKLYWFSLFRFIFIGLNFFSQLNIEPKKIKSKEIVFQYLICVAVQLISF